MPAQDFDLGLQHCLVRWQVASVGLLRDDPQRPTRSGAADDDRYVADRAGIAGGLRQPHVPAVVRLGAGRPECAKGLDADLKSIKPLAVVGKVQPVRLMLPQPPPGAESAKGASVAERVEGCDGLGNDAWFAERNRGYQRAQPEVGVQAGEHAVCEPWLRYWVPSPVDL